MAVSNDDVWQVLTSYPRIYLACHTRHVRRRSSAQGLSAQDGTILVHLDRVRPFTPGALATHLGLAKSSLSPVLARLARLGYLTRQARPGDARVVDLRLTASGRTAARSSSVLDQVRVRRLLAQLSPADRRRAVEGLALLAHAADNAPERGRA